MQSKSIIKKQTMLTNIIFGFTFSMVILNIIPLFFPGLIPTLVAAQVYNIEINIDPFEPGALALPFLAINLFILYFGILYYKSRLPVSVKNSIKFILNFEVSRKVAFVAVGILLGIYIVISVDGLSISEEEEFDDFVRIQNMLIVFPEFNNDLLGQTLFVKLFFLSSSEIIFQNIKVIPYIASISLLIVTYFFTAKIAKKRFAGLIAMAVLIQSYTFQTYDSVATYSNFWILFYLLSLYLVLKKWYISPIPYFLSIFSKPLTIALLPISIFFIYNSNLASKNKAILTIPYVIIIIIIIIVESSFTFVGGNVGLNHDDFWLGFTALNLHLRFDELVLIFLPSLAVGLFLVSRKGSVEVNSILFILGSMLLVGPLLSGITGFNIQPYRFISLIVFFSIGIGILLSKKISQSVEILSNQK